MNTFLRFDPKEGADTVGLRAQRAAGIIYLVKTLQNLGSIAAAAVKMHEDALDNK